MPCAPGWTNWPLQGAAHVVPDAIRQEDLDRDCRSGDRTSSPGDRGQRAWRWTCPSLLEARGLVEPAAGGIIEHPATGGGRLVLSGSCSAMTRAQVNAYAKTAASYKLDPVALASGSAAVDEAVAWLRAQPVEADKLVYATAEPAEVAAAQDTLGRERAGAVVEQALARLAQEGFALGVRRFVVAGGETSGAVTQALAADRLSVGREIAPGVPWCFATRAGETFAITLKSGNFGAQGLLRQSAVSTGHLIMSAQLGPKTGFRFSGCAGQPSITMARKSLTLVSVGPVITRSPVASKKP
jgi:uncharacterized protein YgbK (DUF1537 family)